MLCAKYRLASALLHQVVHLVVTWWLSGPKHHQEMGYVGPCLTMHESFHRICLLDRQVLQISGRSVFNLFQELVMQQLLLTVALRVYID